MKKIKLKLLPIVCVLAAFVITSCGKDDAISAVLPSVTVSATVDGEALASGEEVAVGSAVVLNISVSAPGGVNGLDVNGTSYSRADLGADSGDTSGSLALNITAPTVDQIGNTATFEIEAVDDLGQTSAVVTFTYDIIAAPSPDARPYTAVLLAAPQDDSGVKSSLTFFSTNTGDRYSMDQVNDTSDPLSADIDFGYFYGSGTGGTAATLSDPASYPFDYGQSAWGTRNSTTFRRTSLNAAAFNEVTTFADIDDVYEAAEAADTDPGIESGLVEGEVLAFATDASKSGGSKRGLILVNSIAAGDGPTGEISLEILVQEEITTTN
ncbi:hypothetical protein [Ekhidna sp.]|uniref:hypothetical protein n=1 Tax=Ekhidna sp. TaxID=2608089 RepID=UPI003BAC5CF4